MLFVVCGEVLGRDEALVASLLFALAPFAVFYAQEARMYALLMFLGLASFGFVRRFVERQTLVSFAGALLFTEAFLYSHGAGFMLLVSLVGYVGWLVARGRVRQTAALLKIGLAFVLATVLYLPWLRQAASISVGHAVAPGLREVVETLSILLDGFHGRVVWVDWVAAGFVVLAILAGLRREGEMRAIVLSFLVAPVAICIAVSDFYRPIWLDRTLAYIEPFLLMSIAFALVRLARGLKGRAIRWGWAPLPLAAALLLVGTGLQQATYSHQWNMRDAARFLRSVTGEGDVVYVPQRRVFWGLAWYLVGPGSVNPLTTDFSLETPSHALLISKPALEGAPEGAVWWVAYRTADDPSPFAPDPSDPAWDFEDFEVVRVR
jgi:uncharacterized membrane protein